MSPLEKEEILAADLDRIPLTRGKKPPVFLIVVESLREDALSQEVSPYMVQLKKESFLSHPIIASSNSSNGSFYSLFHSNHALYYQRYLENRQRMGSLLLRLVKRAGYNVRFLATSDFTGLDQTLFGDELYLADSYIDGRQIGGTLDYQDRKITEQALSTITQMSQDDAEFVILFFSSTHWYYHWPYDYPVQFLPIFPRFQYLRSKYTPAEITGIRNRYKTAVHYVDSLLGQFINALKEKGLYEDSLIVLTSDHGEEFLEHGLIGHGGGLYDAQVRVPFFLKLPRDEERKRVSAKDAWLASHIHVIPTILDVIGVDHDFAKSFDGFSLLRDAPNNVLSFSAHHTKEFSLRSRNETLLLELDHATHPTLAQVLEVYGPDGTRAQLETNSEWLKSLIDEHLGTNDSKKSFLTPGLRSLSLKSGD